MTDREFYEAVEWTLRHFAMLARHTGHPNQRGCLGRGACSRCRLELLADEAASRALSLPSLSGSAAPQKGSRP